MGPKWEDTEEVVSSSSEPTWDDTEEVTTAPKETEILAPEVSQPEAFGIGAIQGSTLGTAPIASGIGGALMDAAQGIGDKLGLTTDSQLEEQGFKLADKKTGLEGLMSEYYDSRDRMKGLQNAAADQYPLTTLAGNVTGGLPAALATGSSLAKTAGLGAKIAQGAKEGAALGSLASFGSGDAKVFGEDGSALDVAKETAAGGIGGGVVGGAIPAIGGLVKGVGNYVGDLPIVGQVKTAFKGGTKGIKLNEKDSSEAIRVFSTDLFDNIQRTLKENGFDKNSAFEYANEIGIRVDAGEAFDQAIDKVMKGALPGQDKAEKDLLLKVFRELKDGPANKAAQKLDIARAKTIQKMQNKGYELLDETPQDINVQDLIPESEADNMIRSTEQTFQKIQNEPTDALEALTTGGEKSLSKPVTKTLQQVEPSEGVPMLQYDTKNLNLQQLEQLLNNVKQYSRFGESNPIKIADNQKIAGNLSQELRNLSNDALEKAGKSGDVNRNTHNTLRALRKIGADDQIFAKSGSEDYVNNVDKVWNMVKGGDDVKPYRFFESLKNVDDKVYGEAEKGAEFLNEFNDLAKQVKPLNSDSIKGAVMGGVRTSTLTAANKLGQTGIAKGLKNLVELPADKLGQLAERINSSNSNAVKQYVQPLMKAAQSDERKRSAILYGLYQQPAFRQMYEEMGEPVVDTITPVGTERDKN